MEPPELSPPPQGQPMSVMAFTVTRGKIVSIDILTDPERLQGLDLAVLGDGRRHRVPIMCCCGDGSDYRGYGASQVLGGSIFRWPEQLLEVVIAAWSQFLPTAVPESTPPW
jgi:hypothetical protein